MTRWRWIVLLVLVATGLAGCGGDDDGGDSASTATTAAAQITIKGSAFSGADEVKAGEAVTVKNEDGFKHTFTPDDDGSFDGAELDGGDTATVSFPDAGTFSYHCEIHPSMKGSITVGA